MKIIILSNQSRSMAIFWRVLILELREHGYEVICVAPPGDHISDAALVDFGAKVLHYNLDRKGLNPLKDFSSFWSLKKIFLEEKPDMLFATTIKPVIYGCYAAHLAGVPKIFATITGLGYAFEADNLFKKLIKKLSSFMYHCSLKYATGIFFQNRDDMELFELHNIISPSANTFFACGTGVDINHFLPVPFPDCEAGEIVFLLIARLLKAKGISDYVDAAIKLKTKYPHAKFQLLGPHEHGPGAISEAELQRWLKEGAIEYLGQRSDVRPCIAASHVVVLPSWREGTPTSIMEAMSMGRPCVVSDVPGCREVLIDGVNGFFAECKNPSSLADSMEKFLINNDLITQMGNKSRELAVNKFDAKKVAIKIIKDMEEAK